VNSEKTKYDNILFRFKNHPIISWVILIAAFIIALATVTDSLNKLRMLIFDNEPTQTEPHPPVKRDDKKNNNSTMDGQPDPNLSKIEKKILGRWKTDNEDPMYFHFEKILGNRLFGTIHWKPFPSFTLSKEPIQEGKIEGQQFSFITKYQKTEVIPRTHLKQETAFLVDIVNHYAGKILDDKIEIYQELHSGEFNEFTAHKFFDKTRTKLKSQHHTLYTEAYVLPSDGCGVQSLAIGSKDSPLDSGGLRLISYTNKEFSIWDTATSENISGNSDKPCPLNKNNNVIWSLSEEGKIAEVLTLTIEKDQHSISYFSSLLNAIPAYNHSTALIKTEGKIIQVVISPSKRIIVQEIIPTNLCRMHIFNNYHNASHVVDCMDNVTDITINRDGSQIAWVSSALDKKIILNSYNLKSKQYNKQITVKTKITSLAYSPTEVLLAVGHNDGKIIIIDPITGSIQHTLINGLKSSVANLLFNHDGKIVASTKNNSSEITIWELPSEKILQILENKEVVTTIAFGDDSRLLAAGGNSGEIRVWAKH